MLRAGSTRHLSRWPTAACNRDQSRPVSTIALHEVCGIGEAQFVTAGHLNQAKQAELLQHTRVPRQRVPVQRVVSHGQVGQARAQLCVGSERWGFKAA